MAAAFLENDMPTVKEHCENWGREHVISMTESQRIKELEELLGEKAEEIKADNFLIRRQNERIEKLEAELSKPPDVKLLLVCKCGWYGAIEDQDALGSECGCCPDCGNEDLKFLIDLWKQIKELEALVKVYESKPASVQCPKCNTIIKTV